MRHPSSQEFELQLEYLIAGEEGSHRWQLGQRNGVSYLPQA